MATPRGWCATAVSVVEGFLEWHSTRKRKAKASRSRKFQHGLSKRARNTDNIPCQTLKQAASSPDYPYYLTYIFTDSAHGNVFLIRYGAAIQLKNHIKLYYPSIAKDALAYIKSSTLNALKDANPQLRSFAGTIITEIIQQGGILQWSEVLQELLSLVSSNEAGPAVSEAAMSALAKVCEDNRKLLDKEYQGQRPTTILIPKLLDFAGNSNPQIRVLAVTTLRSFILQKSQVLFANLDVYLQKIFELATDQDVQVRRTVCQSLVQLVDLRPDMLTPHIDGLVNYILSQQQSSGDPELALDAAEFWLSVAEQDQLRGLMGPYLERIIPVLLAGMVYGEEDIERLGGDEDNADQDDRAEDLKPQFAQSKAGRGALAQVNGENGTDTTKGQQKGEAMEDGEVEDDEDEDDWEEDDDPEEAWSLRKCSAAALDVFAVHFHAAVFNIILPYLRENLSHTLWPKREAAVLALGAIAEGCLEIVAPHLPELVPFLISLLSDDEPVVRQITCWCLSRYSEWAAKLTDPTDVQKFFEPMMEGLLKRMLDKNKKVQEAGASSFASLEEKAGDRLTPYVQPILQQFVLCFSRYREKNMYILYDCLQTLADNVGSELAKPELVNLLMPTLINRWNKIDDQSREMFPLLGCLCYIAGAYGPSFSQFADPIFNRCINLIYSCLQQHIAFSTGSTIDQPDKDFVVTALDLVSAIIQAVEGQKSTQLVLNSQPAFYDLLSFCMEDPSDDVRQSAYALLGDCAIMVFPTLESYLPKLMQTLIKQLDLDQIRDEDSDNAFNVVINVCWSSGEIALRAGGKFAPYVEPLYQGLIEIVKNEECPDGATENAAIALGRMGLACPEQMAPHLGEIAEPFLNSLSKVASSEEKASAFLGFNNLIQQNPQAMEGSMAEYFTAIAQFPYKQREYAEVKQSFGLVIQGYKQMIPDFASFLGSLSTNVQQKLRNGYSI